MPKFKADVNVDGDPKKSSRAPADGLANGPDIDDLREPDLTSTLATIGVIGVGVALFDLALIPGMIIGLAAAFAPKYLPKVGDRLEPLFNTAVRGAYKATRMARGAVAEAQEKVLDIAAEVDAEEAENARSAAHAP
jgi:hypothetical protein